MRKVCCIVQYSKINSRMSDDSVHYSYYEIDRMTVIPRNGNMIDMTNHHIRFPDHDSMIKNVLMILKNNNMYVGTYKDFNVTWYEIEWINSDVKGSCERWYL